MKSFDIVWVMCACVVIHEVTATEVEEGDYVIQAAPECTSNEHCPDDKTCDALHCTDPCLNFCGENTSCNVTKHFPVCSCLTEFIGNPIEGCHQPGNMECISNENCAAENMCVSHRCMDPCPNFCGENAFCNVTKHFPVCSCFTGFIGNPIEGCHKPGNTECISNENCAADRMCVSQRCVDPCVNVCGNNSVCHVSNHMPVCSCKEGFIGNGTGECHKQDYPVVKKTKKYFLVKASKTWSAASDYCQSQNGQLATVMSSEENEKIVKLIQKAFPGSISFPSVYQIWVGGGRTASGQWLWYPNALPMTYTNWGRLEPNNWWRFENCLAYMQEHHEYKWNDFICSVSNSFVCETNSE